MQKFQNQVTNIHIFVGQIEDRRNLYLFRGGKLELLNSKVGFNPTLN
jgi:hypothetical protein